MKIGKIIFLNLKLFYNLLIFVTHFHILDKFRKKFLEKRLMKKMLQTIESEM